MAKNTKYGIKIGNIPFIARELQGISTTIYADSDIQALSGLLVREARNAGKKDNDFLKHYEDLCALYANNRGVEIRPIGYSRKPSPEGKQLALKLEF